MYIKARAKHASPVLAALRYHLLMNALIAAQRVNTAYAVLFLLLILPIITSCQKQGESLPGDFPPGLTTYPGSQIVYTYLHDALAGSAGCSFAIDEGYSDGDYVVLVAQDSLTNIAQFYMQQAQTNSLEAVADFDLMRMFDYYFGNDDYIVNVRASLEDDGFVMLRLTSHRAYECMYDTRGFSYQDILIYPNSTSLSYMHMGYKHMVCFSTPDAEEALSDMSRWWHSRGWEYTEESETEYQGHILRIAVFEKGGDIITCYIGESLQDDMTIIVELFRGSELNR